MVLSLELPLSRGYKRGPEPVFTDRLFSPHHLYHRTAIVCYPCNYFPFLQSPGSAHIRESTATALPRHQPTSNPAKSKSLTPLCRNRCLLSRKAVDCGPALAHCLTGLLTTLAVSPTRTSNLIEEEAACLDDELDAVTNDTDVAPSAAPPASPSAAASGAKLTPLCRSVNHPAQRDRAEDSTLGRDVRRGRRRKQASTNARRRG